MTTTTIVDGITYEELSLEEFEQAVFHIAGEDPEVTEHLLKELRDAILQEVLRSANAEKNGKTPAQVVLERHQEREQRLVRTRDYAKQAAEKLVRRMKNRLGTRHRKQIRKNVEAALRQDGLAMPVNIDVHHLVACLDIRAERARAILRQYGIDIDSIINAVCLPKNLKYVPHPDMPNAYAHTPVHTSIYYVNITFLLVGLVKNPETTQEKIIALLRDIAKQLTEGTFPLHARLDGKSDRS